MICDIYVNHKEKTFLIADSDATGELPLWFLVRTEIMNLEYAARECVTLAEKKGWKSFVITVES